VDYSQSAVSEEFSRTLIATVKRCQSVERFPEVVLNTLATHDPQLNQQLVQNVLDEFPAYTLSRNPNIVDALGKHIESLTTSIAELLIAKTSPNFSFISEYAKQQAEQHIPIEAALHAYRCVQKTLSYQIRQAVLKSSVSDWDPQQALLLATDLTQEFIDCISRIFTRAYVTQIQLLADVAGDRRTQLLGALLEGRDESDGRITSLLRDEGYLNGRMAFCVSLIQTQDPSELLNPQRARRLIQGIDEKFQHTHIRRLIDMRDNKVTIIFSGVHRKSGWSSANAKLSESVGNELAMLQATILIGVSSDVHAISHIPRAYNEAQQALSHATLYQRTIYFTKLSAFQLLFHLAQAEFSKALPVWAQTFDDADQITKRVLFKSLKAYANSNMNMQLAARSLEIHPNTLVARFQRIQEITGLNPKTFDGLTDLLLVALCLTHQSELTRIAEGQ